MRISAPAPTAIALAALVLSGCTVDTRGPEPAPTEDVRGADIREAQEAAAEEARERARERAASEADYPVGPDGRVGDAGYPKCDWVALLVFTLPGDGGPGEPWVARVTGRPVDTGATAGATGPVERAADGTPVAYTVVAGDTLQAIGRRLCFDSPALAMLNGIEGRDVTAGEELALVDDPENPITKPAEP